MGKKIWLLLLLLVMAAAAGCGKEKEPETKPEGTYRIYYLNSSMTRLAPQEYYTETKDQGELIRELIGREDKRKPLSDQAIVNALKEKHIDVSRRGVAKYRDELGIRGSFTRRAME